MATNLRRSSLFSRKFALSRKAAALSLPPGRESIRQDAEGFDDLDEYFANSPLKMANKRTTAASTADPGWSVRDELGEKGLDNHFDDYAIPDMEDGRDYNDNAAAELGPNEIFVDVKGEEDGEVIGNGESGDYDIPMVEPSLLSDSKYISDDDHEVVLKSNIKITPPKTMVGTKRGRGRPPASKGQSSTITATQTPKSKRSHGHRMPTLLRELKEPLVDIRDGEELEEGRRSRRQRMAPLAFWRNEKVIYGRRQSAKMPVIVDVLRKDSDKSPTKQLHPNNRKSRKSTGNKRSATMVAKMEKESRNLWVESEVLDYEEGNTDRCTLHI